MNIICEWLMQLMSQNDAEEDIIFMNGLNKCMTIRENQLQNKDVRIVGCEDSYIYIDTNVQYAQISHCINCTIMVAAVNIACSIDMCENTNVIVASHFLRIGNCIDCSLHSYTELSSPVIYGDSRGIVMSPHNCAYPELMSHLREADISFIAPGAVVSNQINLKVKE